MAPLVAVRPPPVLQAHYAPVVNRGQAKKGALGAGMGQLLIWLNAIMRAGRRGIPSCTSWPLDF